MVREPTIEERVAELENAVIALQSQLTHERDQRVRIEAAWRRLRHGEVPALDAGRPVRLQEALTQEDKDALAWLRAERKRQRGR